jgi:four helix bundle protein
MSKVIQNHYELDVYQMAFESAMKIFELSKKFPKEERYSLTDQIRRASRSVCANITEAWRKRRYRAAFVSKLNDAEGEAAEVQTWLEFSVKCNSVERDEVKVLYQNYNQILGKIVNMIIKPEPWILSRKISK